MSNMAASGVVQIMVPRTRGRYNHQPTAFVWDQYSTRPDRHLLALALSEEPSECRDMRVQGPT
jgi:hypothetical protein